MSYPLDQGRSMAMNPRWFRQFALILSALVVCLGGCRFRGNLHTAAIEHRNLNRTIPPRLISKPAQVAKRLPEETSKTSDVSVAYQQLNKELHSDETSQTISGPLLLLRSHESSSDSDDLPLIIDRFVNQKHAKFAVLESHQKRRTRW